ncbi:hypothetical protein HZF24_06940 [Sedimentibacter hydroxybenzoicus DSM 7310]|uniref:Uncharacterized protein n=1 Tax=Sedimentibacter hydroxybenzoicus DSM 7310 TaxID=1123245 RepID=A0A974BIJ4_SEDHY|nr:hypothetical protein [Sedimentibacter hydroxybenzoicus]NYB73874.1 hypothetical protein [Sedimentibacter hydroxybenzoicus DSM 7310]
MTLEEELKERYEHWNHLKQYGCQDPFWEDGCNMNLVRNHIIYIKRQMEEQGIQSELLDKEIPPEVDRTYIARADEIRKNANKSLSIYKKDKDYQYLISVVDRLNKRQIEDTCIKNVIGYCRGLEEFIKRDALVDMRRHERYERYLQSFRECRKRVEEILKEPEVFVKTQLSIMDFIGV